MQTVTIPPPRPSADLLVCPVAVRGLPTTGEALIPPDWRAGIQRTAASRGLLLNQVTRLLAWHGVDCG